MAHYDIRNVASRATDAYVSALSVLGVDYFVVDTSDCVYGYEIQSNGIEVPCWVPLVKFGLTVIDDKIDLASEKTALTVHLSRKSRTRSKRRSDRTHRRSPRYKAQRSERVWLDEPKHSDRKRSMTADNEGVVKVKDVFCLAPIAWQEQFQSMFERVEELLGIVEEYIYWEDAGWSSILDAAREIATEASDMALALECPELADLFAEVVA